MYKLNKKYKIILIIISIIIIAIIGYFLYKISENEEYSNYETELDNSLIKKEETKEESKQEEKQNIIIVHVAGQVNNPGIIQIEENCRISDAIEKAGGLTDQADITQINLAYFLEDGIKIYIPSHNEVEEEKKMENEKNSTEEYVTKEISNNANKTEGTSSSKKNNTKTNINTASQAELQNLPGIGEATALKIINYRNENGKFKTIEDLKNVKGIGESKFENIKNYILVK